NDLAFVNLGKLDQLEIDFAHAGKIVFHNLDIERRNFLQALENVETTAATIALERVRRIRNQLQFAQDELGCDDHAVEEAGFGDVGDAAVDNHAGVENLVAL